MLEDVVLSGLESSKLSEVFSKGFLVFSASLGSSRLSVELDEGLTEFS